MAKGGQRARKSPPQARRHPVVPAPGGGERLERLELAMRAIKTFADQAVIAIENVRL